MISELNDDEILDFLMTSDFIDDYSPSEFKYLLTKWKYFYRLQQGNYERIKVKSEGDIDELKSSIKSLESDKSNLQKKLEIKQDFINNLKIKKLTWKERFSGKIIINENKNEI